MKPNKNSLLALCLGGCIAAPLEAALLHHYKFDETTGTTAEDFTGTEDGTIGANVTLGTAGRLGTSFQFPAVANSPASRVTLPAAVVPGVEFTMSAFVMLTGTVANAGQMHVISGNNGAAGRWNLAISDGDATAGVNAQLLWFHNGGVGAVSFTGFNFNDHLNEWVHVGITRASDGATTLYLNGAAQSVGTSTAALVSTPVGIGMRPNAAQFQLNGHIDDVRFYNNALSQEEMTALAEESGDTDEDGLPDDWELFHFETLAFDGDDDPDNDGFNNRIEFLAGTDPDDENDFPTGDSDEDGMDDGWEWLNFGTLARDGFGDFDGDGSLDIEEFLATRGLLVTRNPNGSVANVATFLGSSDPTDPRSQPDDDDDGLPDGYEFIHFGGLAEDKTGQFDSDGFDNGTEFLAGSNPARSAGTPDNFNDTTRVAVARVGGIDEFSVTHGVWTFVRQLASIPGTVQSLTGHPDGYLYVSALQAPQRIVRVNPANGEITTVATRGEGDAATAGWNLSDAQGIEVGPDGKLYFSTAFGSPAGEGVFRVNTDGSGFEQFIARTGGVAPDDWILNNARDLQWSGSTLYVSARAGFNATNRPVYSFDSTGAFVTTIASDLVGPQGLALDENGLLVTSTSTGPTGLYLLDLAGPFPVAPVSLGAAGAVGGLDIIDLNGDTYYVSFNTGPGGVGQIVRRFINGTRSVVVEALPALGSDLAIFESSLVATPYEIWATGFGINPVGPGGGPSDDFDGDGTTNDIEFALGLDPTDGTSRFGVTLTGSAATGVTLNWPSVEGASFQVRSSSDLADWSTLEATVVGQEDQTSATWTAPPAAGGRRFYRVEFTP
jgi:hypothetical protein